ncbi:MAG TPA: helix-turn-helix domain-containing protein [Rhizomicrobium sp.]|nr:helix-turn-helix domain-containing protein [Rhizomicrobium sp.]
MNMMVQLATGAASPPSGVVSVRQEQGVHRNPKAPLNAAGFVVQIPKDEEIFAEGDSTVMFYMVVSGIVRTCKFLDDGRRQIAAFYTSGEVFGFDLDANRKLGAEAVSDCTLIRYRRSDIALMAQRDHSVSHQLLQYAMQSLAQAQCHALLLATPGAARKVASFLLDWQVRFNRQDVLHLAMTRQEIADYLALPVKAVSRSLSQFDRAGLIALRKRHEVRLLKPEALKNMAASR